MNKERFEYVCTQCEQGRDVFVKHPQTGTEGRVVSCSEDELEIEDTAGRKNRFNYQDLEEITRSKEEWPRRD